MTGRAAGYCAGYPVPGFMNPMGGGWTGYAPPSYAYGVPPAYGYAGPPSFAAVPAYFAPRPLWGRGGGLGWGRGWGRGFRGRGFGRGRRAIRGPYRYGWW